MLHLREDTQQLCSMVGTKIRSSSKIFFQAFLSIITSVGNVDHAVSFQVFFGKCEADSNQFYASSLVAALVASLTTCKCTTLLLGQSPFMIVLAWFRAKAPKRQRLECIKVRSFQHQCRLIARGSLISKPRPYTKEGNATQTCCLSLFSRLEYEIAS